MRESAIGKTEPQSRRDVEHQALFATENSTFRPENSDIAAHNSNGAAQSSDIAAQNLTFRPQNSNGAVQSSTLRPQHPKLQPLSTPHSPLPTPHSPALPQSALLPAGEAALHIWKPLWEQGWRTFKWKIGVQGIAAELELLHSFTQSLPATANLRLDANGGLSLDDAAQWLEACDAITANPNLPVVMEYLEQPLAVSQFQAMQHLSDRYTTPIALDESVATLQQLQTCYEDGWRSIFVIKPAIVGSPTRLRQFCQDYAIDAVFSSALETAIGRHMGLRLAKELGNPERAMGYGTAHWFNDVETSDFAQLWQTL
ncbi:MAG: o-succinylbenzoate synthase [Verrucomicrobia bacterium]|nr:o-succinylbenzoate synthase [Leptolyngbya sp. ES-bin-22]